MIFFVSFLFSVVIIPIDKPNVFGVSRLDLVREMESFVRRERFYGAYSRSFNVKGIDTDAITAGYADGVLTLTMPKKTPEIPASRKLEIQ